MNWIKMKVRKNKRNGQLNISLPKKKIKGKIPKWVKVKI